METLYQNSEMQTYLREMEAERTPFNFIAVDFLIDTREAEKKYKEEYKNDTFGIRTNRITFNDWLEIKKYDAARFFIKHSNFNVE